MKRTEIIKDLEEMISNLQQTLKDIKKLKKKDLKVYSCIDNGGYGDDPTDIDYFNFNVGVEEDGVVSVGFAHHEV